MPQHWGATAPSTSGGAGLFFGYVFSSLLSTCLFLNLLTSLLYGRNKHTKMKQQTAPALAASSLHSGLALRWVTSPRRGLVHQGLLLTYTSFEHVVARMGGVGGRMDAYQ